MVCLSTRNLNPSRWMVTTSQVALLILLLAKKENSYRVRCQDYICDWLWLSSLDMYIYIYIVDEYTGGSIGWIGWIDWIHSFSRLLRIFPGPFAGRSPCTEKQPGAPGLKQKCRIFQMEKPHHGSLEKTRDLTKGIQAPAPDPSPPATLSLSLSLFATNLDPKLLST